MTKFEWSETFFSIEGEGPYAGHPTAYVRFTKCNFECRGYNNPANEDTTSIKTLGFDPQKYNTLESIPLITKGCDSIYSWDEKFSHLWKRGDETDLANSITDVIPNGEFVYPNGKRVILSLTGGEPTLRAKFIPSLLKHPSLKDVQHVLIETNCSVPMMREFIGELNMWLTADTSRRWTWSNSPKLSDSGEPWDRAIRPDVAMMQRMVTGKEFCNQVRQYFKFVCGPSERDFAEVERAMNAYYEAGIPRDTEVYIMPMACQQADQTFSASAIAKMCMDKGYIYCHRVHLDVFGNTVGT